MKSILASLLACTSAALAAPLTPSQLNDRPDDYDGSAVVVKGYLAISPGGHVLYSAKADLDLFSDLAKVTDLKSALHRCLTIYYTPALKKKLMARNMADVVLKGRFHAHYIKEDVVDPGACVGPTAMVVEEILPEKAG